jgi:hypothetical protein
LGKTIQVTNYKCVKYVLYHGSKVRFLKESFYKIGFIENFGKVQNLAEVAITPQT